MILMIPVLCIHMVLDDETIAISARSKGEIDVSSIMKVFGGGGNETSAAARVKGESIESVIKKLEILLNPASYLSSSDIKISFDEERLSEIENRLECIRTLKRKYGNTIEEILSYKEDVNKVTYISAGVSVLAGILSVF